MSGKAEAQQQGSTVEDLGTVKRVLRRPVGDAERKPIDVEMHELHKARITVEKERKKASTAGLKLKHRRDEIQAQLDDLHEKWSEPEIEAVVECRVERTPTELRIIRLDTNLVVQRRALNKDEMLAMGSMLPGIGPRAKINHPEMQPDSDALKKLEEEAEGKAARAELKKPVSLDSVLKEVEAEGPGDDEDDEEEAPTTKTKGKKRPGKGKKAMNQTDLPTTKS